MGLATLFHLCSYRGQPPLAVSSRKQSVVDKVRGRSLGRSTRKREGCSGEDLIVENASEFDGWALNPGKAMCGPATCPLGRGRVIHYPRLGLWESLTPTCRPSCSR